MQIEKLYIQKNNEPEFEIHEKVSGLSSMGITKSAPVLTPNVKQLVGTDSELINTGWGNQSFYAPSTVTVKFYLAGQDVYDYKMLVSNLYQCVYSRDLIRIHDEVEPNVVYYVFAKPAKITPVNTTNGYVEMQFINPSGFRYSIANCDVLDTSEYNMNMTNQDEVHGAIKYSFDTPDFWLWNASDIDIDPYVNRHELKITMNCNGNNVQIQNFTTGTEITINGALSTNQQFVLNGVDSFVNNQPYGLNTDMGYITLAKGWNQFSVSGTGGIQITFSFPFIYL